MGTTENKLNYLIETKNNIKDAIVYKGVLIDDTATFREYANAIKRISSEGGSGIIDVTELPTENVDENAVYRVTESYKSAAPNIWAVTPDEETGELTVQPIATLMGEDMQFNIIEVDNIEDMIPTDTSSENVVVTANILRTNGIAYLYIPVASSDPIPFGVVLLETEGFDKGYTDDPYAETDIGIYTTTERYDTFKRYFVRADGKWQEISTHISSIFPDRCDIDVLSGEYVKGNDIEVTQRGTVIDIADMVVNDRTLPSKVLVNTIDISEFFDFYGGFIDITLDFFLREDGSYNSYWKNGAFAFWNINTIEFPPELDKIPAYAFYQCKFNALNTYALPYGIVYIKSMAFEYAINLHKLELPETLKRIDNNAFYSCAQLESINLPNSLEEISMDAFYYCSNLHSLEFPERLKSIGSTAFGYCTNLSSITFKGIPEKIDSIAFGWCKKLTTINVPWSEGEVANAPWGAANATINYNYTGE